MGQYRKHFTHNAVDGRLLLSLDMHMLKAELKISPFGHRATICDAIKQLRVAEPDSQRSLSPEARSGLIRGTSITICRANEHVNQFIQAQILDSHDVL